jgi:hypothetical protein
MDLMRLRQPAPGSVFGREGAVASVLSACPCRPPDRQKLHGMNL